MRVTALTGLASWFGIIASGAIAADALVSETLLTGTRWMAIGVSDRVDTVPLERLLLIHMCTIADIAFVTENGKLTKYDRGVLAGRNAPIAYAKVDSEAGREGGTLVTLHTATDSTDVPDIYLIDAGGEIMRLQMRGENVSAYMRCSLR
jgi:hypothetical protein